MPTYQYRFSFGYGLTPVVKNLMMTMGAVYVLQLLLSELIFVYLGLVPYLVLKKLYFWQMATYIFLHGGISHLLFNLLGLWMFGGEIENYWGSRKFLGFFLFCGIGAGLCTVVFTPPFYQRIPVIGASGAIYGILLAFGWLFPNRLVYIYFLFPIPAKYLVILYGLIEFFSSVEGRMGGGVAHLTHLGGLLFGLFYMAYPMIRQRIRREYHRKKWSQKHPGNKNDYN